MEDRIRKLIISCVASENTLFQDFTTWREPVIGFVDANDPRVSRLKQIVSKDHLLPNDILPDAKSVLCFFVPFAELIGISNITTKFPSNEWALTYIRTNALISTISNEIEALLSNSGYAVGKIPATHNFDCKTLISNWSHRHLAHISGIGSFGINNMLITDMGCCGRLGSIVTNYHLPRSIITHKERCLNKTRGTCGLCVKKCVNNAFDHGNYDRFACYEMCLENAERHKSIGYADVCGKCVVGLPCSFKDPL